MKLWLSAVRVLQLNLLSARTRSNVVFVPRSTYVVRMLSGS
jgi:hypothetical protein